jgi:hypothetical protein
MDQSQQTEQEQEVIPHCYWHPEVETRLSCSRCGKNVCTQCMVQAPVGIRCRECGRAVRPPTFEVRPTFYAKAIAVGAAIAIGGVLLWAIIDLIFRGIPYVSSLVAIAVGYAAGELISLSVNRKRGVGLAWIAGGAVVIAFLISLRQGYVGISLFTLLFVFVGILIAVQRVR